MIFNTFTSLGLNHTAAILPGKDNIKTWAIDPITCPIKTTEYKSCRMEKTLTNAAKAVAIPDSKAATRNP